MSYQIFEHTADLGLRIEAQDLGALFADAAEGLFSLLVVNLADVQTVIERTFVLTWDNLPEYDYLLFDWLTELLYAFETESLVLRQFDIHLNDRELKAVCRGELVDRTRHELDHEVKAITYHGLLVEQTDNGWVAEVIVDI